VDTIKAIHATGVKAVQFARRLRGKPKGKWAKYALKLLQNWLILLVSRMDTFIEAAACFGKSQALWIDPV
jgi:hypothetical protein